VGFGFMATRNKNEIFSPQLVEGDENEDLFSFKNDIISPLHHLNQLIPLFPTLQISDLQTSTPSRRHPHHLLILRSLQTTSLLFPLLILSTLIIFLVYFFSMKNCETNLFLEITSSLTTITSSNHYHSHHSSCCFHCSQPYLITAVLFLLVVIFSYLFLFIFLTKNQFFLNLFCGVSFAVPSCLLTTALAFRLCHLLRLPLDLPSLLFILWNLFIGLPITILTTPSTSASSLHNGCILWTCLSISWLLFSLSEITIGLFVLLMILWDLFAVTHPLGPISLILSYKQQWLYMAETSPQLPHGLTYKTTFYELGTGDIIFLGVLIGRGCMTHEIFTTICCVSAVLMGVILACLHSIVMKKTVPALPGALGVGLVIYLLCRVLNPQHLMTEIIQRGLYL
jgi:hypothetical protein